MLVGADNKFHVDASMDALTRAGYSDYVVERSGHPYCRSGQATFAFLAQGMKRPETQGYVCTGYFGEVSIHETRLYPDEDIDWH